MDRADLGRWGAAPVQHRGLALENVAVCVDFDGECEKRNIWVDMGTGAPYLVVRLLVTFPGGTLKGIR